MNLLNLGKDLPSGARLRLQDIPALRQLGTLLVLAGTVALGLWIFFWSQRADYVPVAAGLDAKSTEQAAEVLRAAQIKFRIDPTSGALAVPEDQLPDARMKIAGAGLSSSGPVGFEMMEKDPGFGVSQFVENARYQHALETELARTIKTLQPVRDARVHLAIPKPSAFTRQRSAAGASVVLDLHPGRRLEGDQIEAITHLLASSVPDLDAEHVTVVDQQGRLLSTLDPTSDEAISAAQFEQVRRQELSLNQRIQELLEPLTGPGKISAQVAVDMDFSVIEEARETYTPDPAKLRSEQTAETSSATPAPAGVPGAASNTPPGGKAAPAANTPAVAAPVQTSRSATRNFELDRTLSHRRQPAGTIKRVTTAVLVDNLSSVGKNGKPTSGPMDANTLKRVEALVKEAVGFDPKRGDSVSVMNAPFAKPLVDPADASPPLWENPMLRDIARAVLGIVAVLALLFGVLRPALRQVLGPKPERSITVTDENDYGDGEGDAAGAPRATIALPSSNYEDQLRMARTAATTDSKRVAQVVKDWVGADV